MEYFGYTAKVAQHDISLKVHEENFIARLNNTHKHWHSYASFAQNSLRQIQFVKIT